MVCRGLCVNFNYYKNPHLAGIINKGFTDKDLLTNIYTCFPVDHLKVKQTKKRL